LETETIHRLFDEKNWPFILREINHKLLDANEFEDYTQLVWMFENLDSDFREKHARIYFLKMWKIAFKAGKIKLAKNYAETALDYLIELKRIPAIRRLKQELVEEGLFKTHKKFQFIDFIIGKKGLSTDDVSLCEAHPEMWKTSKNILKNYLLNDSEWSLTEWKLAYEYVLKFYYDKDFFLQLADKSHALKKHNHKKKILQFLAAKKVDIKSFSNTPLLIPDGQKSDLHMDYDKLAMDVMSGLIEPSLNEQKRIIISIKDLSTEELLEKGSDMIVAFGLLGMDKVVVHLCERMLPILSQVKQRASIQFMMAQALYNNSEYYKVIDLVDDITGTEPLIYEEMLAFNYLKAESFLKLKKYKQAKELFLIIKKNNPHYRLVGERLRHLEEIK
jgi:hypothetical protein